eukprot:9268530-Pyramimonas_sp.AAC.1
MWGGGPRGPGVHRFGIWPFGTRLGAPERVEGGEGGRREGPRDVQEGAKMAPERSKRAQDRTRAI